MPATVRILPVVLMVAIIPIIVKFNMQRCLRAGMTDSRLVDANLKLPEQG